MAKIKLVIDSGTNLTEEIIKEYDIEKVDLNITFGDENFLEKDCLNFYDKMKKYPFLPKTSAPTPERYIEIFERNMENIVLSLTSKMSGTYFSAKLAKDLFLEKNNNKVEVIDTLNGCIGSGLLAIFSGELIKQGKNFDEVVAKILEKKRDIIQIGLLETLENAIKGGRISKSKAFIANALNLKPIIEIVDGEVEVTEKVRGIKAGLKILSEKIIGKKQDKHTMLGIAHSNNIQRAIDIKNLILEKTNFERVVITEIGAVLGTYTSEGAILVAMI